MKSKGFSDQSAVLDEIHEQVFDMVDKKKTQKFGDNYKDVVITYYSKQSIIKVYEK